MTRIGDYELFNLDRQYSAALGGEPSEHDHGAVYDRRLKVYNPITGQEQDKLVFSGTLAECWQFIGRPR